MKLFLICIVGYIINPTYSFAQLKSYQFEDIDSLQKIEKRTVVVFIYTDWCKYCHAMKNTTLKDKKIVNQLNNNFYFIALNAEEKRTVIFKGQSLKYKPTGNNTGIHQLAEQLATVNNKIAYPTICFLNANYEIIFQVSDYINISNLNTLLESALQTKGK